ncbi:MAG: MATE family efflux transporter, partial [Muribaculaceae bacterium]|nr:MATE family efflux transporter [Muribaculaceae bacterium]
MAKDMSAELSAIFHSNRILTPKHRLRMVVSLSWPSIMAQLSSILMECIDASMVGSTGANASASIGLVATTTWLFWGLGGALATGFFVQVAHYLGANRNDEARDVLQQSILSVFLLGAALTVIGTMISGRLPIWLGGSQNIT